jgi:hypothetical protein
MSNKMRLIQSRKERNLLKTIVSQEVGGQYYISYIGLVLATWPSQQSQKNNYGKLYK